jgi:hypothetical protein
MLTTKLHSTLAALSLVLLAAPTVASESIKLKTGKVVRGTATAYDGEKQILHFQIDGGELTAYPIDQLDARSVYLVYSSVIPKENGKGQLQLANLARDAGLYEHAGRRYGYAEQADPKLKPDIDRERAKGRAMAADFCLKNAKDASAKGDTKEAEKWLNILLERLPNEPQAAEAVTLVEASYTKTRATKEAKVSAELTEELQKEIKKGKASYQSMVDDTQKGLTARNDSQAERLWKSALKSGETVLKECDRLLKEYGTDPRVQEGVAKYRQMTTDQLIEANLHLASKAMTQSSLKEATRYCNAALSLDPQSGEAKAMRARIEQASNQPLIDW